MQEFQSQAQFFSQILADKGQEVEKEKLAVSQQRY
jgi:hypothetical protein